MQKARTGTSQPSHQTDYRKQHRNQRTTLVKCSNSVAKPADLPDKFHTGAVKNAHAVGFSPFRKNAYSKGGQLGLLIQQLDSFPKAPFFA